MNVKVATGLERVLSGDDRSLTGLKIGIIANPTSVTRNLRHGVDCMNSMPGVEVAALFGPEHGIRGDAQDMIAVGAEVDAFTGLPVYSLYGSNVETLSPPRDVVASLDAVVFDIQDVGSRYYTYVWTMVLAMRVCAQAGTKLIVLDRPNPLGGAAIEGGAIEPGFESFVGLMSVPNRHGLTAGEIAVMTRAREQLDVDLHVVEMAGWSRNMYYEETGLPWVLPSPNMPTVETAVVYPGMCLVEGTELSEARGSTRPFEIYGAPFIDPLALIERAQPDVPGALLRPLWFTPTFHKHAEVVCGGVQIHVCDRDTFRPYRTAVALLGSTCSLYPDQFGWREKAYEFVEDIPAIDLLTGSTKVREGIVAGASVSDLEAQWQGSEEDFRAERRDWLLYE